MGDGDWEGRKHRALTIPRGVGCFSLPTARPCVRQTGTSTGLQHPEILLVSSYIDVVDRIVGRVIEFNPGQRPPPRGRAGSESQPCGVRFGLSVASLHPELPHLLAQTQV